MVERLGAALGHRGVGAGSPDTPAELNLDALHFVVVLRAFSLCCFLGVADK